MTLDPLILSRLQFVWVISWHIMLPAVTVGLASYIAFMEGLSCASPRFGSACAPSPSAWASFPES